MIQRMFERWEQLSGVTESVFHVHRRRGAFENTECADNRRRHAVTRLIDLEVLQRAFGLRAPVFVGGDLNLAKGIAFDSGRLGL